MEAVAAFVFASGGAVGVTELARFFAHHPVEETAFYAAVTPLLQLKKIFHHYGAAHGLAWVDADPDPDANADTGPLRCIVHNLTDAQRVVFPRMIQQLIPQSLDAIASLLRQAPGGRAPLPTLMQWLSAMFPYEAAFVKGRYDGIASFVLAYDATAARIGVSETELWLVQSASPASRRGSTTPSATTTTTTTTTSNFSEEEEDDDGDTDEVSTLVVPLPLMALQALRVVVSIVAQSRVFRSPFSPAASVLIFQVYRLACRPVAMTTFTAKAKPTRPIALSAPSAPSRRAPEPDALPLPTTSNLLQQQHPRLRLLVPTPSHGLTWTWTASHSTA